MAIGMIQANRARKVSSEPSPEDVEAGSPVKTVLGSLAVGAGGQGYGGSEQAREKNRMKVVAKKPSRVEDVPFRRQDRRILNARNRRLMDRKLIVFILSWGLLLIALGASLLILRNIYQHQFQFLRPFIVVGPVLILGGVVCSLFSVEVCLRLYRANKRVQDPDLDNLVNPHEVKHWMDPRIIPFGWGLYREDQELLVEDKDLFTNAVGKLKPEDVSQKQNHLERVLHVDEDIDG